MCLGWPDSWNIWSAVSLNFGRKVYSIMLWLHLNWPVAFSWDPKWLTCTWLVGARLAPEWPSHWCNVAHWELLEAASYCQWLLFRLKQTGCWEIESSQNNYLVLLLDTTAPPLAVILPIGYVLPSPPNIHDNFSLVEPWFRGSTFWHM
jgi:hypothetical protein